MVPSNEFDRLFAELRPRIPAVQVEPVLWSNLPSPHVTPDHMFRLARDIDRALRRPSVCGAVVLHGTDVLVESAYMADLTVRTRKPVVFTGAMRYYSETGFDGIRNLLNGIKACVLPLPPATGVVLLMTDRIFSARDVIKVHSLNVDAFEAPECGPVAYVAGEDVRLTHAARRSPEVRRPLIRAADASTRASPSCPATPAWTAAWSRTSCARAWRASSSRASGPGTCLRELSRPWRTRSAAGSRSS